MIPVIIYFDIIKSDVIVLIGSVIMCLTSQTDNYRYQNQFIDTDDIIRRDRGKMAKLPIILIFVTSCLDIYWTAIILCNI